MICKPLKATFLLNGHYIKTQTLQMKARTVVNNDEITKQCKQQQHRVYFVLDMQTKGRLIFVPLPSIIISTGSKLVGHKRL